jgi:hypothetical protein
MDLADVRPSVTVSPNRVAGTHSYLYSPHLLYSPHVLYPSGFMDGYFPLMDLLTEDVRQSLSNMVSQQTVKDISPMMDNEDMRP